MTTIKKVEKEVDAPWMLSMKWKNWSPQQSKSSHEDAPQEVIPPVVRLVLEAIPYENTRHLFHDLLRIAFPALQKLAELNDHIFQCYSAYNTEKEESGELDLMITLLRNDIFQYPHQLIKRQAQLGLLDVALPEDETWNSGEFDFGDFESHTSQPALQGLSSSDRFKAALTPSRPSHELAGVQENEIDEAFDFFTDHIDESDIQTRIDTLAQDLALLGLTLGEQIQQHEARLRQAFREANYSLVIRELDASRTTLLEGIFAFVSSIFACFLEDFDTSSLPGYRDALEQALIAREGTTQLLHDTNDLNQEIQKEDISDESRRVYIASLHQTLNRFIGDKAFNCLSPANRWELVNFVQQLQAPSMRGIKQASEGLSKYLESLQMMDQSEILQQHDQDLLEEVQSQLEAAQSILEISPINAVDIICQVQKTAQPLFGRQPHLDIHLKQWEEQPFQSEQPEEIKRFIEQMQTIIR